MNRAIEPGYCLGPYEIKDLLGKGALGVVYRARQASLERDVAVKVLAPAFSMDSELVERFQREARTAAALHHPNIVTIHDNGAFEGYYYIAMELLNGPTLAELTLPLEAPAAVEVIRQLAEALAYAHRQGVIHRDLKPENAIIDDSTRVTLTDFGVARVLGQASLTLGGGPVGTPEFMSPEQACGQPAGAPSDVYSLGLLLYYLLTGASPFRADTAMATMYRQIHEPLPPLPDSFTAGLRDWVARCCAKDPGARYSSGEAALEGLLAARSGQPGVSSVSLDAMLRGETTLPEALALHQSRAAEIRETYEQEATALSLDVVRSTLLKAPGQTILASFTFGALRRHVQGALDRHGCTASTWSGDGMMALFPRADNAVQAAEEILAGLPEFNSSHSGLQDVLQARVGIHTGRILMTEGQTLGEVTSPTLDIAGHLQKAAPPDSLLMSEETFSRLSRRDNWQRVSHVPGIGAAVYGKPDVRVDSSPSYSGHPAASTTLHQPGMSSAPPAYLPGPLVGTGYAGSPAPIGSRSLARRAETPLWPVAGWSGLVMAAMIPAMNESRTPTLWIAAIVWASIFSDSFRTRAFAMPFSTRTFAMPLSILGLVMTVTGNYMSLPYVLLLSLGLSALTVASELGRRSRDRRRGYVALEQAPGAEDFPQPALDALMDAVSRSARLLGYPRRQLGVRVACTRQNDRLNLHAEVFDRDSGAILSTADVLGRPEDAAELGLDLARILRRQMDGGPHAVPSARVISGPER